MSRARPSTSVRLALLLTLLWPAGQPRRAEACGYWTLHDHELHHNHDVHCLLFTARELRRRGVLVEDGVWKLGGAPIGEPGEPRAEVGGRELRVEVGPPAMRQGASFHTVRVTAGSAAVLTSPRAIVPSDFRGSAEDRRREVWSWVVAYLISRQELIRSGEERAERARGAAGLKALRGELASGEYHKRFIAGLALAQLGGQAIPTVLEVASRKANGPVVRMSALLVLLRMGPAAGPALPGLERLAGDRHPSIRKVVCKVIGALGPAARDAAPTLRRLGEDPDPGVSEAARAALAAVEATR